MPSRDSEQFIHRPPSEVPEKYQGHPLLAKQPFLTLPMRLLDNIERVVGLQRFDSERWAMERDLSIPCGDHSYRIGFSEGYFIRYRLLRWRPLARNQYWNCSSDMWRPFLQATERREQNNQWYKWEALVRRGYCGWLLLQREFLSEHNQLFSRWRDFIRKHGMLRLALPLISPREGDSSEHLACSAEFGSLSYRWRLRSMEIPFLPEPDQVHFPGSKMGPVMGDMTKVGTAFYLPDIFPVPTRDTFRDMFEESLRSRNDAQHLSKWFKIVNAGNTSKKQIEHSGRIFELRHFLRALHSRHADALNRKRTALTEAFAAFFKVSPDSVKGDWKRIDKALGASWLKGPQ